jgi:glycine hydroxymethyltransferase
MQIIQDVEIEKLICAEQERQSNEISLIASENYAPQGILYAVGSVLCNKYAEGLPGARYYGGCGIVDDIERLAIDRCKRLFCAEHVNVQPHSGSQANMAVYMACLKPGDTILGMDLASGGHLTHGFGTNFSGKLYHVISYGVDRVSERINYDVVEELANLYKPKIIVAGASAYPRCIDFERFARIAHGVGALLLADIAHIAGLVAARLHPSPVPYADFVTSTTHKTLAGPRGAFIMCKKEYARAIDRAVMPGIQGGPFMHVITAKAMCFAHALKPEFVEYQGKIITNAQVMVQALLEYGYRIVSGGTDNHLFIVDLTGTGWNGRQAQNVLEKVGLTVSGSCIPFDRMSPAVGGGIRIGTAAMTMRGMGQAEALLLAELIHNVLQSGGNVAELSSTRRRVKDLCAAFPI